MIRVLSLTLALALLPAVALADVTGPARVIEGDTIEVAGQRIRLHGIDAPEIAQRCRLKGNSYPCGEIAIGALKDLTAGIEVRCERVDADRNGHVIATCYDNHGFSINLNMVYTGWALADREYSTRYVTTEDGAREAKRGLWRGEFEMPWEWRKANR
jgi:endonuclease YncB( thermonuclease family)